MSDAQRRILAAAAVSGILLTSGRAVPQVQAECATFRDVCTEFEHKSIILVADVIEVSSGLEPVGPDSVLFETQTVRLRVIEAFKGIPADQQEVTARIQVVFAEDIGLKVGRYLVYAQPTRDGRLWQLSSCSRTKPLLVKDEAEVQQLRQCAAKQ